MSQTDLLGDPLPEPLPQGARLSTLTALVGHTILAVFEGSQGTKYTADLTVVTDTRCWITVDAVTDEDNTFLHVAQNRGDSVADFVHAVDATQKAYTAQVKEDQKSRLRRQLELLEAQS